MSSLTALIPEPAVSRPALLISAGIFWLIGAGVLLYRGYGMLASASEMLPFLIGAGLAVGAAKYHFVLSKTVRRNADRIRDMAPHKDKVCVFAFQSLLAYILVLGMMGMGVALRTLLDFPRVIGTLYIAVGAALALGAFQYFAQSRRTT